MTEMLEEGPQASPTVRATEAGAEGGAAAAAPAPAKKQRKTLGGFKKKKILHQHHIRSYRTAGY